jgi:hypothetical protein
MSGHKLISSFFKPVQKRTITQVLSPLPKKQKTDTDYDEDTGSSLILFIWLGLLM